MKQYKLFVMSICIVLLLLALSTAPAKAQTITQIIDGSQINGPAQIAVDGSGNVYVSGCYSDNAFKITPGGLITKIIDATGDGAGNTLYAATGIAVDGSGNVYVVGEESDNAFKITPGGVITEIIDATGDGAGNTLDRPIGIAVDGDGNVYVPGHHSDNAFKITPNGVITEIIDTTGDGAGSALDGPTLVAVDGSGNAYFPGRHTDNAFKVTLGGLITEIIDATGDGAGNTLNWALGVAVDGSGNVYVSGRYSDNAFKITPGGYITKIIDAAGDGAGNLLDGAIGIAVDGSNNVYVSGYYSHNAFTITPSGVITKIIDATGDGAGNMLEGALRIAVDDFGNVYVSGHYSDNAFKITLAETPTNASPLADAGSDQNVEATSSAGAFVTLDGSGSTDPDSTPGTNDDIDFFDWYEGATPLWSGETINYTFPLGSHTVTLVVTDFSGETDSDEVVIVVEDTTSPEITIVAPEAYGLYPEGDLVLDFSAYDLVSGNIIPPDLSGTLTDASGFSGPVEPGDEPIAGVYELVVSASDAVPNTATSEPRLFVVYYPTGGFVTGGGWICSSQGPYPYMAVEGRANFGFVSKYKKGATTPTGQTEFVFKAGDLNFHSSSYDWLVVTGSDYARFKGWGSINGEEGYHFMLWAGDGAPDTFRIKIWLEDGEIENVVYDNGMNQPIEGGSIVIHAK